VSAGSDFDLQVYDLVHGRCLQTLTGHADVVLALCLVDEGRVLISGGFDGQLRIWQLEREKPELPTSPENFPINQFIID